MSGRNLDYGKKKSSSREGDAMKKELLTMAKDMYNLYRSLDNEDDLPQWCHYKIARSSLELSAVSKYLLTKITKKCLEENITEEKLRKIILMSLE